MKEKDIANMVLETRPFVFRNDCGVAWVGGKALRDRDGNFYVKKPKRISYGLMRGSGDYIGWTPIEITPDMVGKKIAVFTSCEIKTKGDRMSSAQKIWHDTVKKHGGISEIWTEEGLRDEY